MATLMGLMRLGRDAEAKYTQGGDAVVSMSLAYSFGKKGEDGKRPTQWVDASLWGKLGEALVPYLKKGSQVCVTLDDVHMHSYSKKDGETGVTLRGTVRMIELAGGARESAPVEKPREAPRDSASKFDDFVDDIPF